jgi:hypothetical protein
MQYCTPKRPLSQQKMESHTPATNVTETAALVPAVVSLNSTPDHLHQNSDGRCINNLRSLVVVLMLLLLFTWTRMGMDDDIYTGLDTLDFTPSNFTEDNEVRVNRLLYIVTTSTEYNTGSRAILFGTDRLMNIVVPVIQDSVESMMAKGYKVDIFLILAYNLTEEREKNVSSLLPEGTGLEVWNDARPYDYDARGRGGKAVPHNYVSQINRALARQHRYVVKDKFFHYDMFVAFEDDMRITGEHIDYYLAVNAELDKLKRKAPDKLPRRTYRRKSSDLFFGPMTKQQLKRFKPGFMRVEVLTDEVKFPTQEDLGRIDVDLNFTDIGVNETSLDPSFCCHTTHVGRPDVPRTPNATQLVLWETGISGFALREMPPSSPLGWVGLLAGPMKLPADEVSGQYWGSEDAGYGANPRLLAQSAGWMMTNREVLEFHAELCEGAFLPPFDLPTFGHDGLYQNNVEYWSGGIQMWCFKNGCNIQRIVSLDPTNFSKHLLYHSANNKQKALQRMRHRLVKVNNLLGQLNTYRKQATAEKLQIIVESGSRAH